MLTLLPPAKRLLQLIFPAPSQHYEQFKELSQPKTIMKSALARFQWPHVSVGPIEAAKVAEAVAASDDTVCIALDDSPTSQEGTSASDELPLLSKNDPNVDKSETLTIEAAGWRAWNTTRVKALSFIVFSSLNFSIASACVKYESSFFGSQEAVFWRSSIGLLLNFASRLDVLLNH
jgi:hypothetical protein